MNNIIDINNYLNGMTDSQQRAFKAMVRGENIFLTGEGGTGKSFVVKAFMDYCDKIGVNVIAAAHTALAAQNVHGMTLAKAFGIKVGGPVITSKTRARASVLLQEADIVIIDEISMCRIDQFNLIIRKLNDVNKKRSDLRIEIENGECFNVGQKLNPIQVVLVGDFFQLPPIIRQDERKVLEEVEYHAPIGYGFAFQSPLWHSYCGTGFRTYKLTDVVRQTDPEFIANLNKARIGDTTCVDYFNSKACDKPIPGAIWLFASNKDADRLNSSQLDSLEGAVYEYKANTFGFLKKTEMPVDPLIRLKHGARVMFTKNGPNYTNGQFGTIIYLNESRVTVRPDMPSSDGKIHNITVGMEKWEINEYFVKESNKDGYITKTFEQRNIGYFEQIPLKLAYAITIHKSQGQTYTAVNLNPHSFSAGMLYVALSRVKSIDGLYLDNNIDPSDLDVSLEAIRFYNRPSDYMYFGRGEHGGARKGAGRKKSEYPTKPMRVPIRYANEVKEYIKKLKEEEKGSE